MIVLLVAVVAVAVLVFVAVRSYNRFVTQRQLIENAWSNVDTELQRAARPAAPVVKPIPAWNSTERPVGHLVDLEQKAVALDASIQDNRARTGWLQDSITVAEQRIQKLSAQDAATHGKTVDPDVAEKLHVLRDRVKKAHEELHDLAAARRTTERSLELMQQERALRDRLSIDELAAENHERAQAASTAPTRPIGPANPSATGPVARPAARRTGPRAR